MNTLTVADVAVRQDAAGRYSLNDLHRAAGGEDRHKPGNWLRLETTTELVNEVIDCSDLSNRTQPVESVQGQGTYAVRELVYAYAMWISPAFHLRVIRAYDALVSGHLQGQRTPVGEVDKDWERATKIRAASGTFLAMLKVCRGMGMDHTRCLTSANRAAIRHHGVDIIAEAGAEDRLLPQAYASATPQNSVGAFQLALESGEFGEWALQPALSRDVYELYAEWCRRRGDCPAPLVRMVEQFGRSGIRSVRLRYELAGAFWGPHGVLLLGAPDVPAYGSQARWYGRAIEDFREHAQLWKDNRSAVARAA